MLVGRHRLLIILPVIILIPVMLSMMPLSLINQYGCSISKGQVVRKVNHYPSRSIIVYQDDTSNVSLISASRTIATEVPLHFQDLNSIFIVSNFYSKFLPLRC